MTERGRGGCGRGLAASALSATEGVMCPSISLPSRSAVEGLLLDRVTEASPGPMTLVSSFFADDADSECRSFSQLLAGAMASPAAMTAQRRFFAEGDSTSAPAGTLPNDVRGEGQGKVNLNLGHSRPMNLFVAQSPFFTVPAGLSPGGLLDSPSFVSSILGNFGMSHQQALAQVTAQAAHFHAQIHCQAEFPSSSSSGTLTQPVSNIDMDTAQPMESISSCTNNHHSESALVPYCDQIAQPAAIVIDKPVDDGYNWRKYGQKQVKGSEYPRSYYRCTHPKCPVKKKVERSLYGRVMEIIYKGQHNHRQPPCNKRPKQGATELNRDSGHMNADSRTHSDLSNMNRPNDGGSGLSKINRDPGHGASEQLSGSSYGEELCDTEAAIDEAEGGGEPEKLRTITDSRIIVQTTSEVDLLDDGYRWRKYGQKVVKRNPHPRSYYKCTFAGCNVRKHIERASSDPKAVITTYEGKHIHDVPAARNSSHNANVVAASADRNDYAQKDSAKCDVVSNYQNVYGRSDIGNAVQRPVSNFQLKGEHEMS